MLSVVIPAAVPRDDYFRVWCAVVDHLEAQLHFDATGEESGLCRITRVQPPGGGLVLPVQRGQAKESVGKPSRIEFSSCSYPILSSEAVTTAEQVGSEVRVSADLITPVARLLTLAEEQLDPHRDRYGLVEGHRSPRQQAGCLSVPWLERLSSFVAAALGLPIPIRYPRGARWAVAVSSDIDVLETDHLPTVLDFYARHAVERPTFMVCAVGREERCARDPTYDLDDPAARQRLQPLREAVVEIGLHGSYLAHDRFPWLTAQKARLESWWSSPVVGHRAHFYRFAYSRSWEWQRRAGFEYDASLGYPDLVGLRSGHGIPVAFMTDDSVSTAFRVLPTHLLDQHFFWPRRWDQAEVTAFIDRLVTECEETASVLCVDWHTYTLGGDFQWWSVFDQLLSTARSRGAYLGGMWEVVRRYPKCSGCASAGTHLAGGNAAGDVSKT